MIKAAFLSVGLHLIVLSILLLRANTPVPIIKSVTLLHVRFYQPARLTQLLSNKSSAPIKKTSQMPSLHKPIPASDYRSITETALDSTSQAKMLDIPDVPSLVATAPDDTSDPQQIAMPNNISTEEGDTTDYQAQMNAVITTNPTINYPIEAMQHQWAGVLTVVLRFSDNGDIQSVQISQPSGIYVLDYNTVQFIEAHWHAAVMKHAMPYSAEFTVTYTLMPQPNVQIELLKSDSDNRI